MQEFNAVKEMVMDAWVEVHIEAIAHGDGEAEAFVSSLVDQMSGYADMSAEDMTDEIAAALGLTLPLDDDTMDAWQTFINQCAKEWLIRWQIATCWPDADILTADDVVACGMKDIGNEADILRVVDDYMDR